MQRFAWSSTDSWQRVIGHMVAGATAVRDSGGDVWIVTGLLILGLTSAVGAGPVSYAYVADGISTGGSVAVYNTTTGAIEAPAISVGKGPLGIAVSRDGRDLYVTNLYIADGFGPGSVSRVSAITRTEMWRTPVGKQPWGIAVTPDGRRVYVANTIDETVSVLDAASGQQIATITVGPSAKWVAVTPDGSTVYVSVSRGLRAIDVQTNAVIRTIAVGEVNSGVVVAPDGRFVYVASTNVVDPGAVFVVSTQSGLIVASIPVGRIPNDVAITPDGQRLYVVNSSDSTVTVVDTGSRSAIATVPVGENPLGASVNPEGTLVYVTNNGMTVETATVSILSVATNTVVGTVTSFRGVASFGNFVAPPIERVVPAIEYFHAGFGHYFVTAQPDEIDKLDTGVLAGWARTGQQFNVYHEAAPGLVPVCRYFTVAFAPKSSHFYAPRGFGCEGVSGNPDWQFEGDVFHAALPTAAGGCPAGTGPVYRLYNNGQGGAPNHRFTTSTAIRVQMIGAGFVAEGAGIGVGWCSPN